MCCFSESPVDNRRQWTCHRCLSGLRRLRLWTAGGTSHRARTKATLIRSSHCWWWSPKYPCRQFFSFLTLAGGLKHNSNWTNMSYPLLVQREPGEIMLRLRFVVRDPEPVISAIHRVSRKKSKWKLKRPDSFINVLDHCDRCVKRLSLKSYFMIGGNHFECFIFPHFFQHIHKRLD